MAHQVYMLKKIEQLYYNNGFQIGELMYQHYTVTFKALNNTF